MSGQPSQGASAVLKGAPLAPLRFLHAHSCLVASSCIEREWSRPTIQRLLESRQPGQDYRIPASRRSVSGYASRYNRIAGGTAHPRSAVGHSRRTSPRPPVLHARSTSKTGLSSRRCRGSRCAIGGSRAAKAAHQSALIPAAVMILPHFCVSRFQNAARSCGEPDLCLAPNLARLASIWGDCSTRLIN
jgi:hypothetical protein